MLLAPQTAACCRLCSIAKGMPEGRPVDQAWLTDENYAAFVSVGAMVLGWSLVAPKRHELNLSAFYRDKGFWQFVDRAVGIVEETYGRTVIFEHGAFHANSLTSCGTAHAHLHIVPLTFSLSQKAIAFDPGLEWEKCFVNEVATRAAGREYLYVADKYSSARSQGWLSILKGEVSQYFRRVIAQELGRFNEFDYKLHPQTDIADASAEMLASAASNSKLAHVA